MRKRPQPFNWVRVSDSQQKELDSIYQQKVKEAKQ
jgi:hypothetical protein